VFGDSYTTTNYCVTPQESFWGLVAQELEINEIFNYSTPGNSFDSVVHLLISQQEKYDFEHDVFLIGIPPLERCTIFNSSKSPVTYQAQKISKQTWSIDQFEVPEHENLVKFKFSNDKLLSVHESRNWTELQVMQRLFLISQWLDSKQAKYVILNLTVPFMNDNHWKPAEFLDRYCRNHQSIILFDNTYYTINLDRNKPADFKEYG
jgi:hypothetical protein